MKPVFFVVLALWAVAWAAPVVEEPVKIVRSEVVQNPEGSYKYEFESEDGISRTEEGKLKEVLDKDNKPVNVVVVRGYYVYPVENGFEKITYTADENGFHPEGPSIPKPASR